ncbi:hypothetical protein ACIW9X_21040 [Bacteroides fragilis]|jgi:hypothetical protein
MNYLIIKQLKMRFFVFKNLWFAIAILFALSTMIIPLTSCSNNDADIDDNATFFGQWEANPHFVGVKSIYADFCSSVVYDFSSRTKAKFLVRMKQTIGSYETGHWYTAHDEHLLKVTETSKTTGTFVLMFEDGELASGTINYSIKGKEMILTWEDEDEGKQIITFKAISGIKSEGILDLDY